MLFKKRLKVLAYNALPYGLIGLHQRRLEKRFRNTGADIIEVNYNTVNYCNSHCVMCNMWKHDHGGELSLDQFRTVLSDPIFKNVQGFSFVGGEPTLLHDLKLRCKAVLEGLPNLKGIYITTNALLTEKLKNDIIAMNEMCRVHKVSLLVQLSVDGLYKAHDINRGTIGSFHKNMEMIEWLDENKIPYRLAATITKHNVWDMDAYLNFLKNNGLYSKFRIAVHLNRLDNLNSDAIQTFVDEEYYQLQLFFHKLIYSYETNISTNHIYRSILNILEGGQRLVDCRYKDSTAIVLDYNGDLYYCTANSIKKGNLLGSSGKKIYVKNIGELEKIKHVNCPYCIHDVGSGQPNDHYIEKWNKEEYYKGYFTIQKYLELKDSKQVNICEISGGYNVFITGWYGTETTGDKAILAGVIGKYKNKYGNILTISISSLYPFITKKTVEELEISAKVIPVYSESFFEYASSCDEVVVAGGPLMELEELSVIQWAFHMAKKQKRKTTVYGCGIGPLYSEEKKQAVRDILFMSDQILLRDEESVCLAGKLTQNAIHSKKIDDPAVYHLNKINPANNLKVNNKKVSFFLRELSYEYFKNMPYNDFLKFKDRFEEMLAVNIIELCHLNNLRPHFYAMHNFVVGNDDRDFNLNFATNYLDCVDPFIDVGLSTIDSVVRAMRTSVFNVCMRFHSVVFAHTINSSFAAIDYTSGGKIHSFLSQKDLNNLGINLDTIVCNKNCLDKMFHNTNGKV